jgi:hypothetical protein
MTKLMRMRRYNSNIPSLFIGSTSIREGLFQGINAVR